MTKNQTSTPPRICTTVEEVMASDKPRILAPEGRFSYVYIWKPDEEGKYRTEIIWPKTTDLSLVKALCRNAKLKEFKPDAKIDSPIKDGDTHRNKRGELSCEARPELKGCWFATLHAYSQPIDVLLPNKQKIVRGTADEGLFYAGCYGIPCLTAFAYSKKGTGVSLVLQGIAKQRDGEPLGSRANVEADFESLPAAEPDAANDPDDDDGI